jgi:hypothetical protein
MKVVKRPVNTQLFHHMNANESMIMFLNMFRQCRVAYGRIAEEREDDGIGDMRATLNLMRKEVRTYIEQVFPGMLSKGESTHLLRKIYLQLAYKEFGKDMKETGFVARVFAHEGYATALHYTSVQLV